MEMISTDDDDGIQVIELVNFGESSIEPEEISNLSSNTHNEIKQNNNEINDTISKHLPGGISNLTVGFISFFLFTCIMATAGIIIVCLTAPKPQGAKCELKFSAVLTNPIEYKVGTRSIAVADLNNDTWLDLVITDSGVNEISIYYGDKDGNFIKQNEYSTGSNSIPYMVAIGDLNNDYQLDIVVTDIGINNIRIFFGSGNGSFINYKDISTYSSRPIFINLVDFNNDTLLDMITINYGKNTISIYYSTGNGTFLNPLNYSTGYDSLSSSLITGDFNNDQYLDIAITNYGTNNIQILFGNHNGSLSNEMIIYTGINSHPSSIAVGYFNMDSFLDIAITNYGTKTIGVFINNGNGNFPNQTIYPINSTSPYSIDVGDFNQDNEMDLAIIGIGINNTGLLLGYGDGTFSDARMNSSGSSSSISFAICDFNKDNRLDMIIVNNDTDSIDILLGYFEGYKRPVMFTTGSSPRSLAVGDFNNDTKLDIVVGNYLNNSISILFGYANGSFAQQLTYGTTYSPSSLAVGDFNNDNRLDIVVVTNSRSNNIIVYLGDGNGSFPNQIPYTVPIPLHAVAVGDFNNDNQLDIVINNPSSNFAYVLFGVGNGSFINATGRSTGSQPYSVAVGDFNNDNQLDIAVPNYGDNTISVILGYGNGSFKDQIIYFTGRTPYFIAVGDFNNDTQLDMAVANYDSRNIGIFLGFGNGSFAKQVTYAAKNSPTYIAVGDINNDTRLDIIISSPLLTVVVVLFGDNDGNGTFPTNMAFYTGVYSYPVAIGDFDNDTRLDIVVAQYNSSNISVIHQYNRGAIYNQDSYASGGGSSLRSFIIADLNNDNHSDIIVANYGTDDVGILFGYGNSTFMEQITFDMTSNSHPSSITINDFNGDNYIDIAVTNYGTQNLGMLLGNGNGSFAIQSIYLDDVLFSPIAIASGNFDNDNRSEVVVAYDGSDNIDIFFSYNTGSFTNQTTYPTGSLPYAVAVGDFNNDTHLDVVVANANANNVSILLGYGNGSFTSQVTYATGSFPESLAVGDFNNDNQLDIVVGNALGGNIIILLGFGNGSFIAQSPISTDATPRCIAIGDFNNDTKLDIVVTSLTYNRTNIFLGSGDGSFALFKRYPTGHSPRSVAIGDFDNDGQLDLVTANYDDNNVGVRLGNGDGSFKSQMTFSTDIGAQYVAVGDFDKDNNLDIVVAATYQSKMNYLGGYGNGSFQNRTTYPIGSLSLSLAVGDFNNDGQLDVVLPNQGSDDISILLGYGNGSFATQIKHSTGSGPYFVAIGDFNHDNLLDIIVPDSQNDNAMILFGCTNQVFVKKTTLSTTKNSRPKSFIIEDFNNDTFMDIVITNSGTNNIGIFLGYGNTSFSNQTTFSTGLNSSPSSIAFGDFNNDTILDIVVTNSASNNIGVFLGSGNGLFQNQTTYSTGPSSRPYSVAVNDINNDSILDIAVTNYASSEISLFLGYSNGTFANQIIYAMEYGSEPFSIIIDDFNGDKKLDCAIANNGTDNLNIFLQTC
ncbi:unnamed protein product [Adineta steineri]|uniref:Uncharacterized protein n=1 Tax=Adineta steineri TaxID=433720 RepID=A0A814WK31_9BILA|nr:unnamed protein product [Adineta steineri]CAF1386046.1 unnamed protein product [Adineta steineri]